MSDSDVTDAILADPAMDAEQAVPTTDAVAVEADDVVEGDTGDVAVTEAAGDDVDEATPVASDDAPDAAASEPDQDESVASDEASDPDADRVESVASGDASDDVDSTGSDDLDDLLDLAGADDADDVEHDDVTASVDDGDQPAGDDVDAVDAAPARPRRPQSMEDVRDRRDLIRLPGDWFVVHTYSGYEQRVKDNLTNRIEALAAEDRIFELVIPTEEVTEFKKGKKQVSEKKFLPGYVLIRMDLDDETWNIVRHTPAVTGFVGATASKPVPLSLREVAATLKVPDRLEEPKDGEELVEEPKVQVREIDLEEGETVRVTTGPFADFTGTIAEINLDQAKLRVMVSVFGRETPLEMPFDQVAKVN